MTEVPAIDIGATFSTVEGREIDPSQNLRVYNNRSNVTHNVRLISKTITVKYIIRTFTGYNSALKHIDVWIKYIIRTFTNSALKHIDVWIK